MNDTLLGERDLRQRDLMPRDRLDQCGVTVVGVGAIGRQVALQLAAIGVGALQLIDFDTVEPVNLAPQGYWEEDLGRLKVEATADLCRRIHSGIDLETIPRRFGRRIAVGHVLMCCVDTIESRRLVWESVRDQVDLFVDGRMAAEVLRVLTVWDGISRTHYPRTFFDASEAHAGSCTARSTIYCANVAAGLMISQFARWLRRLRIEPDLAVNLLAGEMSTIEPVPA